MSFNQELLKLQFKINHLNLVQRVALLFGVLLAISSLWYFLIYEPQSQSNANIEQQIQMLKAQTNTLQDKYTTILNHVNNRDMDALIEKYKTLQDQIQQLNQKIAHFNHRFVSDEELASVLHAILKDIKTVKIENFSTLIKVEPEIVESDTKDSPKKDTVSPTKDPRLSPSMAFYTMTLKGDYLAIMKFLQRMEHLKWQFFWNQLNYQVEEHPDALATIEFYTLKPAQGVAK